MKKLLAAAKAAVLKAYIKATNKIKSEPAIATGGLFGIAAVVYQWIQVNHVTDVRQGAALALPIVVSFVIRLFVTPSAKVDGIVAEAIAKVTPVIDPPAA